MNDEIPSLNTLRKKMSECSDDELDELIGHIRSKRRELVVNKEKRRKKPKETAKVKKKSKRGYLDNMSPEEKEQMLKTMGEFLDGN